MRQAVLILVVLVGGCGSSPTPEFYTLYAEPGGTTQNASLQVQLRRPGLPDYLDRPNIVRRADAGRLAISGVERWGGNLGEMVGATLADNLTQRMPRSTIYTEESVISSEPDVVVEVDVQRFELTTDDVVRLDAQVAIHRGDRSEAALIKRYQLTKKPQGGGTDDMVAAMSQLLAELSEAVARSIASMGSAPSSGSEVVEPGAPAAEAGEPSS